MAKQGATGWIKSATIKGDGDDDDDGDSSYWFYRWCSQDINPILPCSEETVLYSLS